MNQNSRQNYKRKKKAGRKMNSWRYKQENDTLYNRIWGKIRKKYTSLPTDMGSGTIHFGVGALSWFGGERRSDRYGTISLFAENSQDEVISEATDATELMKIWGEYIGMRGHLACVVLQNRQSTHIGDLFHGFSPTTPEIGEYIELGEGTVVVGSEGAVPSIGLKPEDGREFFWLDPKMLYRAHEQTVTLYFIPEQKN